MKPIRRSGRWFSLAGFVLAGVLFAFPFVTVSCEAPGGYGRAAAGATTNYTGLDLVTGGSPSVDGALRPPAQRQPDRLPVQPVAVLALAAVAVGAAVVALVRAVRVRRLSAAATAFAAAVLVGSAVVTARALVESRLREQLTVDMPAGRSAADFVGTGTGAWLCVVTLGVLGLANLIGWWSAGSSRVGSPRVGSPGGPAGLAGGPAGLAGGPAGPRRRKKPARSTDL